MYCLVDVDYVHVSEHGLLYNIGLHGLSLYSAWILCAAVIHDPLKLFLLAVRRGGAGLSWISVD